MKPLLATAALVLATPVFAGPPMALRQTTPGGWESLFREGVFDGGPVGPTRGTVLYADDALFPRLKARLQGTMWKGKVFHGDGTFTNRWVGGVRAGTVGTAVEPSWLDGQPTLAARYSPSALVFRNVRDELRQVGPGVWLGRSYDATTGRPKNWFVLEAR
jgi:hypothetical protein